MLMYSRNRYIVECKDKQPDERRLRVGRVEIDTLWNVKTRQSRRKYQRSA